jgi:hypothetical protein
MQHVSNA